MVRIEIGTAVVFIEQSDVPLELNLGDDIHPVSLPNPQSAFEHAGDFLRELVGIFDRRIHALASRPEEVSVDFSLGFEVSGKATLIPVLLSGKSTTQAAIKVSATWRTETPLG
jgi:hypothetical protein